MSDHIRFHDFPIAGIDAMTASTVRTFPRHTHDQYGIGVVDSGGHTSWSGRGQVEAGPGHFICVNPGEVHDGRAIGHRSRSWRILYVDPALMNEARTDILEGAQASLTFAAPVFADEHMRRLFDAAFAHTAAATGPSDNMECETVILSLVARLGIHSTTRSENDKGTTVCVRRVQNRIDDDPAAPFTLIALAREVGLSRYQLLRNRIDDDPAAPFTLIALAREVGLSRYQLLRGFARELGLMPHSYILQRRIALARRLIRAGYALAEVAAVAGFCDQSHLTRCFVRQFGVTPHRYACNAG